MVAQGQMSESRKEAQRPPQMALKRQTPLLASAHVGDQRHDAYPQISPMFEEAALLSVRWLSISLGRFRVGLKMVQQSTVARAGSTRAL